MWSGRGGNIDVVGRVFSSPRWWCEWGRDVGIDDMWKGWFVYIVYEKRGVSLLGVGVGGEMMGYLPYAAVVIASWVH